MGLLRKGIGYVCALPREAICRIRSWYYTSRYNDGNGRITIKHPFAKISICKARSARLEIDGELVFQRHLAPQGYLAISLGPGSRMHIENQFSVGENVSFYLFPGAELIVRGKLKESGAGITSDARIMVYRRVEIGYDLLASWNIFITDSDWHSIEGQEHHRDTAIGDHVWIGNNCSVLKGVHIGNDSIVASNSKVSGGGFAPHSLIAGCPASVRRENIPDWSREIDRK